MKDGLYISVEDLYYRATRLAMSNLQTVGEKRNYYITLEQLQFLL